MGWTYYAREKGESNVDHFQKQFGEGYTILDGATVGGTFYGAVKAPDESVTGVVILTRWVPNDPFNFGYKDMSEDAGPFSYDCPQRILDLLTPTTSEAAIEWRTKCREQIARKAKAAKVKAGARVRFAKPIKFTNGETLDEFTFLARNTFRAGYTRFTITGWRLMEFEVI